MSIEREVVVGVISDTHGSLREDARQALIGVDRIIHAGDIGSDQLLDILESIAPVTAVRGNSDFNGRASKLPRTELVQFGQAAVYVLHDLNALDLDPKAAGFAAVIHGHTHRPEQQDRQGVLFFNPGSAGPRRMSLPISLGKLFIKGAKVRAEHTFLEL